MWIMTLWEHSTPPVQWGVVISASLVAAVCDVRTRRIPNLLSGSVLVAGFAWAAVTGGWAGLADALAGGCLLAFPFVLLFAIGGGGAGDAKLMGALGSWLGLVNGSIALVAVLLSGGVLAIGFSLAAKRFRRLLSNLARIALHAVTAVYVVVIGRKLSGAPSPLPKLHEMQTMPYGMGIFIGVCIAAGGVFSWRGG